MENIQNKKTDIEKQLEILEINQKKENPMGFAVILREFKKDKLATI